MNSWIWVISIFVVAFILLVWVRRATRDGGEEEGFQGGVDTAVQFADRQYNFFTKLLNRGMFVNNGIQMAGLNAAVADTNVYNTIPEKTDYTQYFSPDPYKEYFDYDATFCKPARSPRNLPARDLVKRVQCGWWYVPDAGTPSMGALGTRDAPVIKDALPPNGQWVWDLARATELEEKKHCGRIRSCDFVELDGVKGVCGFCERTGRGVPVRADGAEKYPDSSDACGVKVVTTRAGCYKPPPPELTTADGTYCGNYGRPSPNNAIRLYTRAECDALNGIHVSATGVCNPLTGPGSFSVSCASLNTPAPATGAARPVCEPDAKGNLTRDCLAALARAHGFGSSGGVLRMVAGGAGPNQTDKYAIDVLRGVGVIVPDAVLGTGAIDIDGAASVYKQVYNAMTGGGSKMRREAAKWLVSGSDSFDVCDFEPGAAGPFPLTCIQREFRQAGCQPAGAAHPSASNTAALQGTTWAGIGKKFSDLYASMRSPDSETQRKATQDCLGIKFYRAPDVECCYIMYGPWISAPGKADRVETLPDGKTVYLKQEGTYTKMVHQSGEARYYVGRIGQFNAQQWARSTVAPQGMYNVRKGTEKECAVAN